MWGFLSAEAALRLTDTTSFSNATVGVGDAEAIPEPASSLLEQLVSGAWADLPDARQLAQHAISTFAQRASDYK